jgi:phosphoglycerol transferase MdoB-like AlkP superfamily enzyme
MAFDKDVSIKTPEQNSRKELIFQVFLPLGISVLIFLLLAVLTALNISPGNTNVHHWANISVILLSLPTLIIALLTIFLLAAAILGMRKLIRWIPAPIRKIRLIVLKVALWFWRFSEKVTSPFIRIRSKTYGLKKGLQSPKRD